MILRDLIGKVHLNKHQFNTNNLMVLQNNMNNQVVLQGRVGN